MSPMIQIAMTLGTAAACWLVALAIFRSTFTGPDPASQADYRPVAISTLVLVTLASFLPAPWGFIAALACWGVAAANLSLPPRRAVALFGFLSLCSAVAQLAILGVEGL